MDISEECSTVLVLIQDIHIAVSTSLAVCFNMRAVFGKSGCPDIFSNMRRSSASFCVMLKSETYFANSACICLLLSDSVSDDSII